MTIAQEIIESAYARSTANDPGKLAQDPELLAHLNRKFQSLFAVLSAVTGDNGLAAVALVFSGGPPASADLPIDIVDIDRVEASDGSTAFLIPASEKERGWHAAPSMYRQGTSLVSRGKAGDPIAGTAITLYHRDAPATINALASVLDARFPVRYENLLVLDLAVYLSVKDKDRDEREYKALKLELTAEMAAFNLLTKQSNTAKEPQDDAGAAQ